MNILEKIYFFVCFSVMFIIPAYAYIDPSLATYLIQAIAGIAVAIGAISGILFRRLKRSINAKLGIDENSNKEIEDDIIVYY